MTRRTSCALWLVLGAFLIGSATPAVGQTSAVAPSPATTNHVQFYGATCFSLSSSFLPFTNAEDPAQLAAAAALFVKVDSKSGTDTILVVNRQQVDDVSTTGAGIPVHVRFYDASCLLKFDNNVTLTPQGIAVALVSTLFGIDEPGAVLADSFVATNFAATPPVTSTQFAISGVVIDGNFGAVYERQGSPMVLGLHTVDESGITESFNWGGFSANDIDDWFIGGFTMLQMMCPSDDLSDPGTLAADMHTLSAGQEFPFFFADFFPVVNVYDAKEVLKRSVHDVPCFCNTDTAFFGPGSRGKGYPGDFADVLVSMKAVGLGTFHWDDPTDVDGTPGRAIGWRVISAAPGSPVHWDARLRTTSPLLH